MDTDKVVEDEDTIRWYLETFRFVRNETPNHAPHPKQLYFFNFIFINESSSRLGKS